MFKSIICVSYDSLFLHNWGLGVPLSMQTILELYDKPPNGDQARDSKKIYCISALY